MTTATEARAGGRGRALVTLLGIAVSVGLLVWTLWGIRPSQIIAQVEAARLGPLLAAVTIATLAFPIRLPRWRVLLRKDDGGPVGWAPLWHAIAVGFLANNVLPLRAGEFVRSYAVRRLGGDRFTAAFSSVAVERVFDGLTVIFLLMVGLVSAGFSPNVQVAGTPVSRLALYAAVFCCAALAVAGAVVAFPLLAEQIVRRVVPAPGLAERLVAIIEGFRHGLAVLKSPGRLAAVVGWSLVLWLFNAAAFWLAFRAFGLPVGYAGALILQGLLVLGISIPSTPGFVGVFEGVIVAMLAMYGIPRDVAVSYALTYHVTTFIPINLLGVWSLVRTPLAFRDLRGAPAE